jgi:hypothetical protein
MTRPPERGGLVTGKRSGLESVRLSPRKVRSRSSSRIPPIHPPAIGAARIPRLSPPIDVPKARRLFLVLILATHVYFGRALQFGHAGDQDGDRGVRRAGKSARPADRTAGGTRDGTKMTEKICPECNGEGVVDQRTEDERRCPTCNGSGIVPDDGQGSEEIWNTYLERAMTASRIGLSPPRRPRGGVAYRSPRASARHSRACSRASPGRAAVAAGGHGVCPLPFGTAYLPASRHLFGPWPRCAGTFHSHRCLAECHSSGIEHRPPDPALLRAAPSWARLHRLLLCGATAKQQKARGKRDYRFHLRCALSASSIERDCLTNLTGIAKET